MLRLRERELFIVSCPLFIKLNFFQMLGFGPTLAAVANDDFHPIAQRAFHRDFRAFVQFEEVGAAAVGRAFHCDDAGHHHCIAVILEVILTGDGAYQRDAAGKQKDDAQYESRLAHTA